MFSSIDAIHINAYSTSTVLLFTRPAHVSKQSQPTQALLAAHAQPIWPRGPNALRKPATTLAGQLAQW